MYIVREPAMGTKVLQLQPMGLSVAHVKKTGIRGGILTALGYRYSRASGRWSKTAVPLGAYSGPFVRLPTHEYFEFKDHGTVGGIGGKALQAEFIKLIYAAGRSDGSSIALDNPTAR